MNEVDLLKEKNLLALAIEAVHTETGLKLMGYDEPLIAGHRCDAAIEIEGFEYLRFTAQVKRWAQQANLGALVNQIEQMPGKGMLVADYVNPKMADKLRKMDVPFIDTMGNAYINEKPLYIFIKGNKKNTKDETLNELVTQTMGRAFQPTGIKVVYALMRDPELVMANYRDIHIRTGAALGTVGRVINDLKQGGFLVEYGKKQRRLKNKNELFNKWVEAYLQKLRPKLFIGAFTARNEYWWMDLDDDIVEYGARWGGEAAAAKMTGHLKPEKITIYMPEKGGKMMLEKNRLHKDPKGNIHLYRSFWGDAENEHQQFITDRYEVMGCVDPMIVYADLIATGDPRNLETARIIYDEKIAKCIQD